MDSEPPNQLQKNSYFDDEFFFCPRLLFVHSSEIVSLSPNSDSEICPQKVPRLNSSAPKTQPFQTDLFMTIKGLFVILSIAAVHADIVVNAARPITHKVEVNRIRTQTGTGPNTTLAQTFGTPSQEADIIESINEIWAQAGLHIVFSDYSIYESAFAYDNNGQDPNVTRPQGDLTTILNPADAPTTASTTDIEMFFVEIAPGFTGVSENSTNGLARVDRPGTAVQVGDNLPGFQGGRDVIAGVMAHEIGHNLGLEHTSNGIANLMSPGGSSDQITQEQIDVIFTNTNNVVDGFDLLIPLTYSEWANANNLALPPEGDSDLDGLADLTEFAMGLNPKSPDYDAPAPSQLPEIP